MKYFVFAIATIAGSSSFATGYWCGASVGATERQTTTAIEIAMGPTSAPHKPGGSGNGPDDGSSKCKTPSGKCAKAKQS